MAAEAAEAAASAWTADVTARSRKFKAADRIWAESAVVARAGSAARGIPTSDPMIIGGGRVGGGGGGDDAWEADAFAPKKKAARAKAFSSATSKKVKRKDVRPSSAPAGGGGAAAFGSRVPFNPAPDAAVAGTVSKKSTSKRPTASSKVGSLLRSFQISYPWGLSSSRDPRPVEPTNSCGA